MKILILDGTEGYYPQRIEEKPTGGIITSLTTLSQLWVKRGHEVTIASLAPEQTYKGVRHVSVCNGITADVVIFNRNCIRNEIIRHFRDNGAKVIVNWLHDIAQCDYYDDNAITNVDKIVALSRYCADSYSDFYSVPRERFVTIPNGVDDGIFYRSDEPRDRNLYLTASAPIKGFGPLDYTFYNLKRVNPNATLRMYCSQSLHDKSDDGYTRSLDVLRGHGVDIRRPIGQRGLADEFRRAWVLLLPNTYPEICSNSLLQARACGLPVIASGIGSVPEFLPAGLYTKRTPVDKDWFSVEYTNKVLEISRMSDAAYKSISEHLHRGIMNWADVATEWERKVFNNG